MIAGRPFRFLLLITGGWVLMRSLLLFGDRIVLPSRWTSGSSASLLDAAAPATLPAQVRRPSQLRRATGKEGLHSAGADAGADRGEQVMAVPVRLTQSQRPRAIVLDPVAAGPGHADPWRPVAVSGQHPSEPALPALLPVASGPAAMTGRWSGSAWLLVRPGGDRMADALRLGGAQAGARMDHAILPGSRLDPAVYVRVSSALSVPAGAEGALGLALRPARLPVAIAVERRQALSDGGRSDFALLAAGGVSNRQIARGLVLHAYMQTGLVGLEAADGFVDGDLRLDAPVAVALAGPDGRRGGMALGFGLWGGAQPGVSRLDIGPQARLRLPFGPPAAQMRVEWRYRIAGNAAPASGPAIVFGMDF